MQTKKSTPRLVRESGGTPYIAFACGAMLKPVFEAPKLTDETSKVELCEGTREATFSHSCHICGSVALSLTVRLSFSKEASAPPGKSSMEIVSELLPHKAEPGLVSPSLNVGQPSPASTTSKPSMIPVSEELEDDITPSEEVSVSHIALGLSNLEATVMRDIGWVFPEWNARNSWYKSTNVGEPHDFYGGHQWEHDLAGVRSELAKKG